MANAIPGVMETEWQSYRKEVLPPDCSELQINETKKAFYAGAGSLMSSLTRMLRPGRETTESDLQIIEGIAVEIRDFVKSSW